MPATSLAALPLRPVVLRLRDPDLGVEVDGERPDILGAAAYVRVAKTSPTRWPTLYVVPAQERDASARGLGLSPRQSTTAAVGVIYAVRAARDPRGDADLDLLTPWRSAVRACLQSWRQDGCTAEYQRSGGAILPSLWDGLWWQDVFVTDYDYAYTRPVGG